jgi:hypothetical protein
VDQGAFTVTLILGLKLTLVPSLIYGITLAGRRWGAAVAGWLSAFPVVSAPLLFFIAREQGPVFAAVSATATLSAVLANLAFGLTYAWSARRNAWPASAALAFVAFGGVVLLLDCWAPSLPLACMVVFPVLFVAPRLYPEGPHPQWQPPLARAGRNDLPWRMAAGVLLVLSITAFAANLGPRLSGLLAMFPVMASVLAVFSQRQAGAAFTIRLLRNMVWGYYAFALFCAVLALALPRLPVEMAFVAALAAAAIVQALVRLRLR